MKICLINRLLYNGYSRFLKVEPLILIGKACARQALPQFDYILKIQLSLRGKP